MSGRLREVLSEVAEASPAVRVAGDLFDRARLRKRRAWAAACAAVSVVLVLVGVVSVGVLTRAAPTTGTAEVQPDNHPPATIGRAPKWIADIKDAPLGRAQFVYAEPDDQGRDARLIVVSGDSYRSAELGGMLSPDGRYLAYQDQRATRLLDLATGTIAMVSEGEPVAWSRKGDFIVLRHSLASGEQIEMSVVSVPSGAIAWNLELVPPCIGNHVALSPDNAALAVGCEQYGTYLYDRDAGLRWHQLGKEIAGPQAWAPDGRTIATQARYDIIDYSDLYLLDVADGNPVGQIRVLDYVNRTVGKSNLSGRLPWTLAAWHDGLPVLQGPDWVLRLSGDPSYVSKLDSGDKLWFATDAIDWATPREQGPIDGGPLLARYRGMLPSIYTSLVIAIAIVCALIVRRIRRRFAPAGAEPAAAIGGGVDADGG